MLDEIYESREITFDRPFIFHKEDAVKVINGIVKTGEIPRHAKPTGDVSAAQNFGYALRIMKKGPEYKLDISGNRFVQDMYSFIDQKLAGEGQTMNIETLYKNFMGTGSPTSYGLSRRMIQLYLLCLVQTGKIRIGLGPKAGLSFSTIDYRTIKEIDFSARMLDALTEVQKMEQPKNWDAFRPFAEVFLDDSIPQTHDDTQIAPYRLELGELFNKEKEEASRSASHASRLFEDLHSPNPYEKELQQFETFFKAANVEEIDDVLYRMKETFGYTVFDTRIAEQADVDDLKLRVKHYRGVQQFLIYEAELRTAYQYCAHTLPNNRDLAAALKLQQRLADKLKDPRPYIDSDVKLRTELIGSNPPLANESQTLYALITEYKQVYIALHHRVFSELESRRAAIESLLTDTDLAALQALEGISAMQPRVSGTIEDTLKKFADGIFSCPAPSRASIESALVRGPVHSCNLSFENYNDILQKAKHMEEEARRYFEETLEHKLEVFFNSAIQNRLKQGKEEPTIAGLLQCKTISDLRAYLTEKCQGDPGIVETINRYLKRIVVKKVRIADFKPPFNIVEKEKIADLAIEFQAFLEEQLQSIAGDDAGDTLPMLQVE